MDCDCYEVREYPMGIMWSSNPCCCDSYEEDLELDEEELGWSGCAGVMSYECA